MLIDSKNCRRFSFGLSTVSKNPANLVGFMATFGQINPRPNKTNFNQSSKGGGKNCSFKELTGYPTQ